jgi:hypothetical protein
MSITRRSKLVSCSTRLGALVPLGGDVAPALLDGHVDGQTAVAVHGGDVEIGVEDLDVGADLQVLGGHLGRAAHVEAHGDGLVAVADDDEVLQVEDDVGDVLDDPTDGVELMQRLVEADLGDGGAGDRRQQDAAERVADGVAEAGLEGADDEPLTVALLVTEGLDGGALDDQHGEDYLVGRMWSGRRG